jgi:hypothetical protein
VAWCSVLFVLSAFQLGKLWTQIIHLSHVVSCQQTERDHLSLVSSLLFNLVMELCCWALRCQR